MAAWYQAWPRMATESSGLAPLARKAGRWGAGEVAEVGEGALSPKPWPMRKWANSCVRCRPWVSGEVRR